MEGIKEVLDISMEEIEGHSPWRSLRAYFSRSPLWLFLFVSEAVSPSLANVYA